MNTRTRTAVRLTAVGAVIASAIGFSTANGAPNGFTDDKSAGLASQINSAKPRNVILIIGDGTDDSMITAARNYELGAAGRWGFDDLPFTGAMTTYGLKVGKKANGTYPINYVSDSAPTASGWSTGKKTVDGRLSQGPSETNAIPGEDYDTVLEILKKQGKRTGNVSTAEITDATPAAAASHINARACQGPGVLPTPVGGTAPAPDMTTCPTARKSAGGKGSVAEQLVDNKIDVILGGGKQRYLQNTDAGPTALAYAQAAPLNYKLVEDKTALKNVGTLANGPILGLFSSGNMATRYKPLVATPAGAGGPTTRCELQDRGQQPSLAEMTDKAIQLLDNPNGFFLQVESAMIDKQEHASDICGAIGDVVEMDDALKIAQAYQAKNPDTLIIVTGDHAHSTQIIPNGGATTNATGATGGKATTTLQTQDGDPMTIGYSTQPPNDPSTNPPVLTSQTHTGSQIRVAASGPQAANVTGTIDQTDLFATMLGRTPSNVGSTPAPPTTPTQPAARKPVVSLAAATKLKNGAAKVKAAVAATDAATVTVTLSRKGTVVDTVTLGSTGGLATLRGGKKGNGTLTVTATATGVGGTATSSTSVKAKR